MFTLQRIRFYIIHLSHLKSKFGFGIHSPYIFKLSQHLRKKTNWKAFKTIEDLRKNYCTQTTYITVSDYGAGSLKLKSNQRQIKQIARYSLNPKKQCRLLFQLVQYFKPHNILELGTSLGISTCYLAKAAPNALVTTLEGCPNIAAYAQNTFKQSNCNHIRLLKGEFQNSLRNYLTEQKQLDFVFFDGNHTKEATMLYFQTCLPYINNQTVFIFHDIYLNQEMQEAWQRIQGHEKVQSTIDFYHMGVVLFKKEMSKEHFKLVY